MFALILWFMQFGRSAELQLTLSNIRQAKGSVYIAVYDKEVNFLSLDKMRDKKIVPLNFSGTLQTVFPNLPPGTYAISCFHDVNGNGKLDTNLLGIPSEPYGFSNNARPKFRAPSWAESKFELKNTGTAQAIRLEKW